MSVAPLRSSINRELEKELYSTGVGVYFVK